MHLHTVNVNDIVILPNRQRQQITPEAIVELASSLSQNGLIHPIVIRREGDQIILVAGERRIKAALYLWQFGERLRCGASEATGEPNWFDEGFMPAVYQGELDPLMAELIEFTENKDRENLTWQDQAKATRRIAEILHELAKREGKEPPTIAELTDEVKGTQGGRPQEDTRRELIVAKFLDDPEVAAAKSTDDAFKILKRKEATQKNIQLATEIGKTFSAEMHQLHNVDSCLWMVNCPAETFDIILTDPPYGMGADEFGDSGGMAAGAHSYMDNEETYYKLIDAVYEQALRITKPQAHLYLFCDQDKFILLREGLRAAGWKPFRTPIVWHKPNGMRAPWPQSGPFRRHELILYAVKGDKPVTRLYPDVVSYPSDENLGHNAQKPIALFVDLLRRSCKPGDTVLDFACGSGTIFPACHEMQCRATGLEIDPAAYGLAAKRLGALK